MHLLLGIILFIAAAIQANAEPPGQRFVAIAFHAIGDEVADLEADSVRSEVLVQFFEWLKGTGWTAISLDDLVDSRAWHSAPATKADLDHLR